VARISASDTASGDGRFELQRVAVTLAVMAAHVALIIVMWRSAGHSAEVVDMTSFALPIEPEDRPGEPVHVQKPPIWRAAESLPRHASAARASATAQPHVEPSLGESSRGETEALGNKVVARTGFASEPAAPGDWYAEARASADALEQRDSIESNRRPLAGPKQHPSSAPPQTPACPFEKCEPNWGSDLGIFESQHSKGGRIEKIPDDMQKTLHGRQKTTDGEVVLWFNNWCYEILVTADRSRQGMIKCGVPLGKRTARGDLFDHMNESPPPEQRATDVP
jgi:hypothetical protein